MAFQGDSADDAASNIDKTIRLFLECASDLELIEQQSRQAKSPAITAATL